MQYGNYRSFDELLQSRLAEAHLDAVALDEIVQQGGWYGFKGPDLDRFIRKVAGGLIEAGMAVVVQAPQNSNVYWLLNPAYQLPIGDAVDKLLHDWKHAPDGYAYFAWFTAPKNLLIEKGAKDAQPCGQPDLAHKAAQGRLP